MHRPARPPLGGLTAIFLRIGNLTFGGGDPTMTALQRELVHRKHWMTGEQYTLSWGLARITPGTNVLAFCAAAGWLVRGWLGALAAVCGACVPSVVLVIWLTRTYQSLGSITQVSAAMGAISAAIVGMMIAGAWLLVRPQWKPGTRLRIMVIPAVAAILSAVLGFSPVSVLGLAALAGYLWKEPAA